MSMAQPLCRPLLAGVELCSRSCLRSPLSRRCFSTTPGVLKFNRNSAPKTLKMRQPPAPAVKVVGKNSQQLANDLGILPQTFVTPRGANRPSFFRAPKTYIWFLWRHFFNRLRDRISLLLVKMGSPKEEGFMRRKIKINRGAVTSAAVGLHRQMYTAFAEADVPTIRKICVDGIRDTLLARIGNRARGEVVTWELVEYGKKPKLISDRSARLPLGDSSALRQAVVRIVSTQKLTRMKDGQVVGNSGKEKEVVEYVVIQKMMRNWIETPWQVWGTTKETTVEDLVKGEEEFVNGPDEAKDQATP